MDEPRTHYQISLTARQAVGLFVGLLLSLGIAFFFGLMAGLSGRERPPQATQVAAAFERTPSSEPLPAIETAVPTARSSSPSRTELAAGGISATPVSAEATPPSTLRPFEDGIAEEASPTPVSPAVRAPAAPSAAAFWVQVASLSSREEASSLARRLSKEGFHTQIAVASGPKGRVFRVRAGPYRSPDEAGRAASRLARREGIKRPWVVPEGK